MAEDISAEDIALLKLLKKEVKETPKGEEAKDLKEWMMKYLATSGELQPKKETTEEKLTSKAKEHVPLSKYREPPRISIFSGSNNKGESTYDLWRYEVCGLMADKLYDPEYINYAVRRSLKGDAGVIAMHLGPKASVPDILHKLDSIFGDVEKKEDLLAQFYRARQADDETVTKWSCRLEDIIGRAVEKGVVHMKDRNSMLHSMLWTGLKTELKDISGHKFDFIQDFDELRVALRQIEKDHEERKTSSKPRPAKATVIPESPIHQTQMDEFKGLIQQLTTRMDRWETQFSRGRGRGYRGQYRGQYNRQYSQTQDTSTNTTQAAQDRSQKKCYRCGLPGHFKRGCTAVIEKKPLNEKKPMEQGRR